MADTQIDPNEIASVQEINPDEIESVQQVKPAQAAQAIQPSQPQVTQKDVDQANFRARANNPMTNQFWSGVVQKGSMGLLPLAADKISGLVTGKQDRQFRDYYKKAADASTGAQVAGSMVNPTNLIPAGGVLANAAIAAGQSGIQDAAGGGNVNLANAATNAGLAGAGSAVVSGFSGGFSGGLTRFQDYIAGKLGPQGFKLVKDLSRSIMLKGSASDPAALNMLQKPGTSRIGLETAQDDAVYDMVNVINPKIGMTQGDISAKIAQNVDAASRKVGSVMDPARQIPIDTSKVNSDVFNMSQNAGVTGQNGPDVQKWLEDAAQSHLFERSQAQFPGINTYGQETTLAGSRLGPQGPIRNPVQQPAPQILGPSGSPLQKPPVADPNSNMTALFPDQNIPMGELTQPRDTGMATRQKFTPPSRAEYTQNASGQFQPTQVKQFDPIDLQVNRQTIPLGVIDDMSKQIEAEMYNPMAAARLGLKAPQQSGIRANKLLQDYIRQYLDPQSRATLAQGNAQFSRAKNLQNISSPGLNKASGQDIAASGFSTNPVTRTASAAMNFAGRRAKIGMFQGTKSIAQMAVNRLNNRMGQTALGGPAQKIMQDMAPFQSEQIARKFQALSQMNDQDAAAYAYAQSMTDPAFRALMTAFSEESNQQSEQR